jgi:site-specific DNA-methyltransferase (adenine-specific)
MRKTTKLYCGDVRAVVKDLGEATVDAVLTDPPYELGFLGHKWDTSGVAFQRETWEELRRVCKPGAPLLAFGGTRTYHRVASAIEEAGWDVRDCLQWLRGNGVPKNSDRTNTLGAAWKGYGDSLKPGHDPIILARNPCDGTTVRNAMEFGCGLLNLDACRIPCTSKAKFPKGEYANPGIFSVGGNRNGEDANPDSRCPTNIILDETAAQILEEQQAGASRFFYCSRATTGERNAGLPPGVVNDHPCVKPLALCRYLATLILPPARDTPRRLLVPFSGSGSEIIGALMAGWDEVVGIEREDKYVHIAERRIMHWRFSQIEHHASLRKSK